MLAVISDIHGNLEALTAVFAEIDRRGIQDVLCLGDVVGYGPDPVACLDMVRRRCRATILGNHDFAVLFEPYNFNTGAESAAYWTRRQLQNDDNPEERRERWKYLASLPVRREFQQEGRRYQAVHASPRRPINEYVFPDDIYTNPGKFNALFEKLGTSLPTPNGSPSAEAGAMVCFIGHTHVPGVFTQQPDFYSPPEVNNKFTFVDDEKALVNVGSVGQPRDRDPRSSFAILSTPPGGSPVVEFVRVEYDAKITKRKVEATGELDDFLGQRLLEGR
jgi:diadenosine tetraphosphatase ApaH/serine/threonine PP2A family protein phosphatase